MPDLNLAGMTKMEAIVASTSVPAEMPGVDGGIGSITVGVRTYGQERANYPSLVLSPSKRYQVIKIPRAGHFDLIHPRTEAWSILIDALSGVFPQ